MKRNIILILVVLLGLSWYTAVSETINNPKKKEAHLEKAEKLEKKGIHVDAVMEYEEALKYDPSSVDISMKLANAYLQSGDSGKFVSVCQRVAETYQEDKTAMDLMMGYYLENGNEGKAVKYLESFLKKYPDNQNAQKWFLQLKGSYIELYCRFDEIGGVFGDSMVVQRDGIYGIAELTGQEIIPCGYKNTYPFSEDGFALVMDLEGKYFYIDEEGQTRMVPDAGYENFGMMSSGVAAASKDGKYGYLDREMEPVGEFVWDELTGIVNDTGAGRQNKKWALLNEKGEARTEFLYDGVIVDENGFCAAQKRIFVKENGSWHIINQKGNAVGDETFEDARAFAEEGYAAVCQGGKWGFVDDDGNVVIECLYEDAKSFQNGFAAVSSNGRWGYIDVEGNLTVQPVFLEASSISEKGTAAVQKADGDKEWRVIQFNLFL